jgi:AraC-like DNA-binding protein
MKTPIFNIHDLILVLTLAVSLLLAIFQLLLSKQKVIASRLLSVFFICVGVSACCNLLLWNDYIHIESAFIKSAISYILVLAVLVKAISLYAYVVAITRENFVLDKMFGLHLLPLGLGLLFVAIGSLDTDKLRYISIENSSLSVKMTDLLWHYLKAIPVAYAIAAFAVSQFYKRELKDYYSDLSLQGPQWLMLLTMGFALNWLWSLAVHIVGLSAGVNLADRFGILDNYITFILVNALFVYSLMYAHQLLETKAKPKAAAPAEPSTKAIEKIRWGMEHEHLYLKQNLNIEEFAKKIGIHYREVSVIINKHFETNFFEYVNLYRVNKAKDMLNDPQFSHMTILDILLESGFNSKSSFHRFFKRYTGMSAADYKKKIKEANPF